MSKLLTRNEEFQLTIVNLQVELIDEDLPVLLTMVAWRLRFLQHEESLLLVKGDSLSEESAERGNIEDKGSEPLLH